MLNAVLVQIVCSSSTAFASSREIKNNMSKSTGLTHRKEGVQKITRKPVNGISEYKLTSNGLKILLVENHAQPVVVTNIVYHVGSRNEAVGFTGATHFLEHLMFKGTKRFDPLKKNGIDDVLKRVGGMNNATTWFDRTNYFEVVPSHHIELCLDIESDRMRNLLLRQSDRDAEMTVVRNELERGEDDPDELLETNLFATAFREHPYHHPTIGWRADVEGVPLKRLRKFYDDFYWPSNATLMVLGDFDSHSVLEMIEEKFSSIEQNPQPYPTVYTVEPEQEGERRFIVRRGTDVPRLVIGYHVSSCMDQDTYALDVLENILGDTGRKSSRLYKRLIDKELASYVDASNYSLRDPGLFVVSAQIAGKCKLDTIEKSIYKELNKVISEKVTDKELEKAKNSIVKTIRLSTADPLGFSMHLTEATAVANWRWWLDYPAKVKEVTAEDIQRVAREYFIEDNRTVGYYYPSKEKKKPAQSKTTDTKKNSPPKTLKEKITKPHSTSTKKLKPIKIDIANRVKRTVLKNGLTILTLKIPDSTTVAISGKILAGDYDYEGKISQVPLMVSSLLTSGSSRFTKEELADKLEMMGCDLSFDSDTFWTEFDSHVVSEDLPNFLDVLANTILEPKFSKKELALEIGLRKSDLKERLADTVSMAWNLMFRELYKRDRGFYQKSYKEQIAELKELKQKDLKGFHRKYFTAARTNLVFVGAVDHDAVVKLCRKHFSKWEKGTKSNWSFSKDDINDIKGSIVRTAQIPDKANVSVRIANTIPVDFKSKGYFATVLANAALGYDSFACRLAPLRDKYGLTYGIYSVILDPTVSFGPWYIKYSVNPDNVEKAQKIIKKIVQEYVKHGITEDELNMEKSHLAGIYSVHLRSPGKIAARISLYESAGVPLNYIDNYPSNLNKVTRDEVNAQIAKYFDISKSSVTVMSGTIK